MDKFISEGNSAGPWLTPNGGLGLMQLEWKKSTKMSTWNARVVSILSAELHRLLQDGKIEHVKYHSKTMTLKFCEKQIVRRLDRVRRDKLAYEENRLKVEQDRIDQIERRRGRRKTVGRFEP